MRRLLDRVAAWLLSREWFHRFMRRRFPATSQSVGWDRAMALDRWQAKHRRQMTEAAPTIEVKP
jgi:hypothetical protein